MSRCRTSRRRWRLPSRTSARRAVGAANSLWYEGDTLRSTNTDVEGFLANLDAAAPGWDRGLENAMVLGAGGGARAVVFGLARARRQPRHRDQPHRGAGARNCKRNSARACIVAGWNETTGLLGGAGLLVNTTTLGMVGQPPLEINCAARLRWWWPTWFTIRWKPPC